MSRQAWLGIFALGALLLLFGMFYVITDYGTRHTGYRIGVHFANTSGLPTGAQVFFSGVSVGTVDDIRLLPDNTVDVILAIKQEVNIPKASKFLVQAPLTGTPTLVIVPPVPRPMPAGYVATAPPPSEILPKRVLPVAEQPAGQSAGTIGDLLAQGQGEIHRLDAMLADMQRREPLLMNTLQGTLANVNDMSYRLRGTMNDIAGTLDTTVHAAGSNIVGMTQTLNGTLTRNQYKIDAMLTSLDSTANELNRSMGSLQSLASDPRLKDNLVATTTNIRNLTGNLVGVTSDLRNVTGNPQTQAELRDTVAQLNATMQKADSLLGALGGRSHVYGVDTGATPYPVPSSRTQLPPAANGTPYPSQTPSAARLGQGLAHIAGNLVAAQLRLSYLNPQTVGGPNPLLTSDRGPQADFNAIFLPKGQLNVMIGANDIGAKTTYNFVGTKQFRPGVRAGGGVLYSQLGALGVFDLGPVGAEARAYNLRRPTFDFYGNLNLGAWAKVFLGERDATHPQRRTVFGLQLQF